jgi:hypothetical protein
LDLAISQKSTELDFSSDPADELIAAGIRAPAAFPPLFNKPPPTEQARHQGLASSLIRGDTQLWKSNGPDRNHP